MKQINGAVVFNVAIMVMILLLIVAAIILIVATVKNRLREKKTTYAPYPRVTITPISVTMPLSLDARAHTPTRGSAESAGIDLYLTGDIQVKAAKYGVPLVDTGVHVAIPRGYVGLIIARSSLHQKGVVLANSVGVIDSDYRGSLKLTLTSLDGKAHNLKAGTRVAQLLVLPAPTIKLNKVRKLQPTVRGAGGFGSTGV